MKLNKVIMMFFLFFIIIITIILIKSIYLSNKIKRNTNYIFSYGSLTNYYVQKILLKSITKLPPKATLMKESGYSRYWFEGKNEGVTLNIVQNDNPKDINGILIELDDEELADFDKYEIEENNHLKIKIDWKFIKSHENYDTSKDLYIYVIKDTLKRANIASKIPNLYAFTVMQGFNRYGEDYLDLFLSNTE